MVGMHNQKYALRKSTKQLVLSCSNFVRSCFYNQKISSLVCLRTIRWDILSNRRNLEFAYWQPSTETWWFTASAKSDTDKNFEGELTT